MKLLANVFISILLLTNLEASPTTTMNDFVKKIKTSIANENLVELYSLFEGELIYGPRRVDIKNSKFSDFFTQEWKVEVLNGEAVPLKGRYMIASGNIWFEEGERDWQLVSLTGWHTKQLEESNTTLWFADDKVISPKCFSYPWISLDNYEEFERQFEINNLEHFTEYPGLYFGSIIGTLDPIIPDWSKEDRISLAFKIKDCLVDQNDLTKDNAIIIDEYDNTKRYEILGKLPNKHCTALLPNLDAKCTSCNAVFLEESTGGSMGPMQNFAVYGTFETKNDEYIIPLRNFDRKNNLLNYIDNINN